MQDYKKELIIIGYSGHAYVMIDAALQLGYNFFGYTNLKENIKNPYNLNYLGDENDINFKFFKKKYQFCVGIGDNKLRTKISEKIRLKNKTLANIFHPDSSIFKNTIFGNGVFIAKNVAINSFCEIHDDVIINTSATIDHECLILSGAHIAPGSVLLGNVKIGKKSFVGSNSVIKEGVNIGDNVIIGAGSVVLNDILDNSIVYGNPAK